MLKKLTFLSALFCLMIFPLHAQETTFTLVSEIDAGSVGVFGSERMMFSSDGTLLAVIFGTQPTGSPSDEGYNGVILYDTQSGAPVVTLDLPGATSTAFSLDGTLLAVSGSSTGVFDLTKLRELKALTQDNVPQALELGVVRNVIDAVWQSSQLGFLPNNTTLYTVENEHFLWDVSQPSDLSDANNAQSLDSVRLMPPLGTEFVLGSFVSGEAGAFAVVAEGDGVTNYSVVSIGSDGRVAVLGQPSLGTELAIPSVSLDGSLMTLAEPFDVVDAPEGTTLQTLRIRADDASEPLFTQLVPQDSMFSIAPNGLSGVFGAVVDGQPVAQFYSTETGNIIGTLPIESASNTAIVFSASNRFAVVYRDADGNGTIRIFDADFDFGLGLTEVTAIDSLGMGLNLPTLTDPEDCETDSESLTGETTESACKLTGDALSLNTSITLREGNTSVTLTYPDVMALNQPSDNGVILGTSQTVLENDFATVPPLSAGEAAISVTVADLDNLPLDSVESVTTPRQVMDGFVSFLTNVDLTLDGAIIDTFAGEYPASVAYFTNANGDVMLLVAQVAPQFYTVFIVISAPDEIVLIEPTVYAMADTLSAVVAD